MESVINKTSLPDAIDYQEGSVVSKQILKKTNGNITLFAFDAGESLTEHTSPYEAVVQIVDGEMEILVGGTPNRVNTGELLILPANVPHGLVAIQKSKMLLTMIK